MKIANRYLMLAMFDPLSGLADDDDAVILYRTLNPNDEGAVKDIIRKEIVPHVHLMPPLAKNKVIEATCYYLSKPMDDKFFVDLFDSILPPFNAPDDARLIFVWAWQECFPGQSYLIADFDDYQEVSDVNETWRAWID